MSVTLYPGRKRHYEETLSGTYTTMSLNLTPSELSTLKKYHDEKAFAKTSITRVYLVYLNAICRVGPQVSCQIQSGSDYPMKIFKKIFHAALKAAFILDGKIGAYTGRLSVLRDVKEQVYDLSNIGTLHHDYEIFSYAEGPGRFPKYLFLAVLNDKNGRHGWEGGELIVQSDSSPQPEIPFRPSSPYLKYSYPLNEGLCLKNLEVVHQRLGVTALHRTKLMARDILIIHLFKKD
jgi:hypothetical protein